MTVRFLPVLIASLCKFYVCANFMSDSVTPPNFPIGAQVRLVSLPPYVKTAEPKPMLRPPTVVQVGEAGTVMDRRPGDYWGVKFANGVFLMEAQYIELVETGAG